MIQTFVSNERLNFTKSFIFVNGYIERWGIGVSDETV